MMASSAEREIRDAVVDWFHRHEPRGRVVHELPLSAFSGAGRADIGVIFPDAIVLVEIKSERDKLSRLEKQFSEMIQRAHDVKLACHEKWFDDDGKIAGQEWMKWSHKEHLWRYPGQEKWEFSRYELRGRPSSWHLLDLLWADELRDAYRVAGVMSSAPRGTMHVLTHDLHQKLTGRQIVKSVCAALRQRKFAEADPVIDAMSEATP